MSRDDIYDIRPMLRGNAELSLVEGVEFSSAAPDRVLLGIVMPPRKFALDNHPFEANVLLETRAQLDEFMRALLTKGSVGAAWASGYRKGWRIAAARWSAVRDAIVLIVEAVE